AEQGRVPAMRYYVLPPVEETHLSGDLFLGRLGERDGYWVLLTPSCDLAQDPPKSEWALLAACLPLEDQDEYKDWHEDQGPGRTERLGALMRNNRRQGQA